MSMRSRRLGAVSGVLTRHLPCDRKVNIGLQSRQLHEPRRQRLNHTFWIPRITSAKPVENAEDFDVGQLLVQTGYLHRAYSGIFHMLPLGLRVQNKLEALIDKHMQSILASKVSLSSITSEKLWEQSGRLANNSEFFRFADRKDARWLLAPTHEEEITSLVRDFVGASDELPLRLYQVSRKYRDEKRPRGGLLRGREFVMKDLYTFDLTESEAHETYAQVRQAYNNLFSELKLPYVEAQADSGNMGGTMSHEFHFPSSLGEDDLITCRQCDYAKNEEFVPPLEVSSVQNGQADTSNLNSGTSGVSYQAFISSDQTSLVKVLVPHDDFRFDTAAANPFVVKKALSEYIDIDTGIEHPEDVWVRKNSLKGRKTVYYLFDDSISVEAALEQYQKDRSWLKKTSLESVILKVSTDAPNEQLLLKKRLGDPCPKCASEGRSGTLRVTRAIEVAHTFHLGTRYSSKLDLRLRDQSRNFVEMGCHGIGVSRLIAAAASASSDKKGLVWPRAIAPFEVVIMTLAGRESHSILQRTANEIYDELSSDPSHPVDVIVDDRDGPGPGWKFKDAQLIGYPVIVAVGKRWMSDGLVEIECRKLDLKEKVPLDQVSSLVREILARL